MKQKEKRRERDRSTVPDIVLTIILLLAFDEAQLPVSRAARPVDALKQKE